MALFSLRNIYCLPDAHFQKQGWGMRLHILVFLSQLSFSNPLLWLSPFAYPHRCTHMHNYTHTHTHTHNLFSIYRDLFLYLPKDIHLYRFKSISNTTALVKNRGTAASSSPFWNGFDWKAAEGSRPPGEVGPQTFTITALMVQWTMAHGPWWTMAHSQRMPCDSFSPPHIRWKHQPQFYQPTLPYLQLGTHAFFPNNETTQWPNAQSPLYGHMYS